MFCLGELDDLDKAVLLVKNAEHGRPPAPDTPRSIAARRIYHHAVYRIVYIGFTFLHALLVFPEKPGEHVGLSRAAIACIEFICLFVFAVDVGIQYVYFGHELALRKRWLLAKAVMVPVFVINVIITTAVPGPDYIRALRPFFLLERLRNVRKIAGNIVKTVPKILNVAILLGMHTLFFGVMAHVLFAGIDGQRCAAFAGREGTPSRCSSFARNCFDYFSTLQESLYHLFILGTTANFPDIMLPVYTCSAWSALFFVVYLVIGAYFLLNLTLAVAYTEFKALTEEKVLSRYANMFAGYDMAFACLCNAHIIHGAEYRRKYGRSSVERATVLNRRPSRVPVVGRETWIAFMARFRPDMDSELAGLLFDAIDGDRQGCIYRMEFRRMAMYFGTLSVQRSRSGPWTQQQPQQQQPQQVPNGDVETPLNASPVSRATTTATMTTQASSQLPRGTAPQRSGSKPMQRNVSQGRATTTGVAPRQLALRGTLPAVPEGKPREEGHEWKQRFHQFATSSVHADSVAEAGVLGGMGRLEEESNAKLHQRCSRRWWRAVLTQRWTVYFFDLVVLINSITVLLLLNKRSNVSNDDIRRDSALDIVQYFTLSIFFLEVLMKMVAWGPILFWTRSYVNQMDGVLAAVSVLGTILELTGVAGHQLTGAVTFFRIIRILRVLRAIPGFALTVQVFSDILPVLGQYVTIVLAVFYFFAIIGMELFHDALDMDNQAVADSSYGRLGFEPYNFASFHSSMVVLFQQMVVNNWPVVMEGVVAGTGTRWARLFFVLHYLATVVMVLNVLVAFIIESFGIQKSRREEFQRLYSKSSPYRLETEGDYDAAADDEDEDEFGNPYGPPGPPGGGGDDDDEDENEDSDKEKEGGSSRMPMISLARVWTHLTSHHPLEVAPRFPPRRRSVASGSNPSGTRRRESDPVPRHRLHPPSQGLSSGGAAGLMARHKSAGPMGSPSVLALHASEGSRRVQSPLYEEPISEHPSAASPAQSPVASPEPESAYEEDLRRPSVRRLLHDAGDEEGRVWGGEEGLEPFPGATPSRSVSTQLGRSERTAQALREAQENAGDAWRSILERSGLDFSKWRIWRTPRTTDIYDALYQPAIQDRFPTTFQSVRRGSLMHSPAAVLEQEAVRSTVGAARSTVASARNTIRNTARNTARNTTRNTTKNSSEGVELADVVGLSGGGRRRGRLAES